MALMYRCASTKFGCGRLAAREIALDQMQTSPSGDGFNVPLKHIRRLAAGTCPPIKFALIRPQAYFTFAKQIFHSEAVSFAREGKFHYFFTIHYYFLLSKNPH